MGKLNNLSLLDHLSYYLDRQNVHFQQFLSKSNSWHSNTFNFQILKGSMSYITLIKYLDMSMPVKVFLFLTIAKLSLNQAQDKVFQNCSLELPELVTIWVQMWTHWCNYHTFLLDVVYKSHILLKQCPFILTKTWSLLIMW